MNRLTKISGVIGLIIILISMIGIVVAFFNTSNEDQFVTALLLIPLFFITQFFVRFKFGFISENPTTYLLNKFVLRVSYGLIGLLVLIIFTLPTVYFIEKNTEEKLIKKYAGLKKWKSISSNSKQQAHLKTKYDQNKLFFDFSVDLDSSNRYRFSNIAEYTIQFMDSDGFIVDEIALNNLTRSVDKDGNTIGYSVNESEFIDVIEYSKFSDWNFTYRLE
jgi:hypothetical protein